MTIVWQVDAAIDHTVLLNDVMYSGTETTISIVTPAGGEDFDFDIINHAEVDTVIHVTQPLMTAEPSWPAQYTLNQTPDKIAGYITLESRMIDVSYKITHNNMIVAQEKLPAKADWSIENPALSVGENLLQITVLTTNGKQYKKLVNISLTDGDLAEKDDDNDGLLNWIEDFLGTDKNNADTDGDGLTNIQEQKLGSRPDLDDTDNDDLTDGDEVYIYMTNPTLVDTDGDGLTDGEEIKFGLNPNDPKSDGVTPDNERTFEQTATDAIKDDSLLNSDNWLVPSISGNVPGDISTNISMERSSNVAFDENHSVLSDVLDISTSYHTDLTLSFQYNQAYTGDMQNLTIVSFINNDLAIIDTYLDEANQTVSGTFSGDGTYFVIDVDEFLKGLGIDVFANVQSALPQTLDIDMSSPKDSQYHYVFDDEGKIIDENPLYDVEIIPFPYDIDEASPPAPADDNTLDIEPVPIISPSDIDTAMLETASDGATGKAEIAFVLDVTGSMDDDIRNVAKNIISFVDSLTTNFNVDTSFALITYNDYYVPINGKYGTRIHKNNSGNWFASEVAFKNEVNRAANEDCGWGSNEVFLDGIGMAINDLGWSGNAAKFIVLLTDEGGASTNRFGYTNRNEVAELLAANEICTSVITENSLQNSYRIFWESTDGLYANIRGNFSEILLGLADKVGESTNAGGEWVFLEDYQAIKLSDTLDNASTNDTDGDGLTDAQELGTSVIKDMVSFIELLLNKHSIPSEYYTGKTQITAWKYLSNPKWWDTDYDGIPDGNKDYDGASVKPDLFPRSNSFIGKLQWKDNDKTKESKQNINFNVDYSSFFKNNREYSRNLSVLASLYAADIYADSNFAVTGGAKGGGSDNPTALGTLFGLKDVEDIKINGNNYGVDIDDSSEFVIGHRKVTYNNASKEVIVVVVRGTNGTNAEWSSNFDIGADTREYYAAVGSSHPDWKNKANHKGFDVTFNRILAKINDYLSRHSLTSGARSIFITGHSRGAAIANLLGAHFENDSKFTSYTYTFAAPNPTTDSQVKNYKTIFNIVNKDDIIAYLPLAFWGFKKYGVIKDISVEDHYENKLGGRQEGTWEWLTGEDYNNDSGTQNTLAAFKALANNRKEVYVLDSSFAGKVWENNVGHTTRAGAEKELATLSKTLGNEKLLKFCKLSIVGGGAMTPYHVEVNYSPAYLMQMLSNIASRVGPKTGHDVTGKYVAAKQAFILSSGQIPRLEKIGGMAHPHLPITYYLIVYNDFVKKV